MDFKDILKSLGIEPVDVSDIPMNKLFPQTVLDDVAEFYPGSDEEGIKCYGAVGHPGEPGVVEDFEFPDQCRPPEYHWEMFKAEVANQKHYLVLPNGKIGQLVARGGWCYAKYGKVLEPLEEDLFWMYLETLKSGGKHGKLES